MFFVGEVEFAVHLRSFRNISVRQPCELALRLTVSHNDQFAGKVVAQPTIMHKVSLAAGVRRRDTFDEYSRSLLQKECYRSKCICVRYQDEIVALDDICVFRTKINAYPCDRLKEAKFNLEVELESARTTLVLGNMPTEIGRCTIEVPMRAAQRVEPYFDVFSFGSAVDATVYIRLVSMQFMNNLEDLQKMVARQSERQRMSHIEHSQPLMLPMHFQDFQEFLKFATNDCSKHEVQRFYDSYVERLKHELLALKKLATEYLNSLEDKQEVAIMNMALVRKLSGVLPEPTHIKRKQRRSIFGDRDNRQGSLLTEPSQQSTTEVTASMLKSSMFLSSNKISDFRLSEQALGECILKDIEELGKLIEDLWKEFIQFVALYPSRRFSEELHRESIITERNHYLANNCSIEGGKPKQLKGKCPSQLVFDSKDDLDHLLQPVQPPEGTRVVILVHGYQAYSSDMERIGSYLKLIDPGLLVYCSSCNQGSSKDKIEVMGQRLAVEVKNFVNSLPGKVSISFICHSMGGLVVRAALPYLSFYKSCMHTLVSVCSPHTGYVFHSSMLVKTGLWVMNKMQSAECLKEMCCEDIPEAQTKKHYIEELAENDGLQWFRNVVLMASREDEYVSYSSARLEKDPQCSGNSQQSKSYLAMLESLQAKLSHTNLTRIRIQFCKSQTNFNSFIGRTAHIQLLTDRQSIRMFVSVLRQLFSPN